jgi:hypothetical protein
VSTFSEIYDKLATGNVGNWLAIVGVLSLIYWGWRIIAAFQNRHDGPLQATGALPAPEARLAPRSEAPDQDIAVIAAAVHAMLGAHRVVHIEADRAGQTWAIEGRWMQQTSHQPR